MTALDTVLVPIHRAGWPFVALFAIVAAVLFFVWPPLGWAGIVLTAWCAYFFRDPPRVTPERAGLVVSPADGRVQMIVPAVPPRELEMGEMPLMRVSIFLSVFDVHVNRIPVAGTVGRAVYRPGRFFNAALDKASEDNERQAIRIDRAEGTPVAVVQIAGLVARRIICDLAAGAQVETGARFGLIRFGSRCDVYLAPDMVPMVVVGQRAVAGETVIADAGAREPARTGTVR